jgi:hypothetical protein
MKAIQVFDPALCCSTGVCGVDVDQALVSFAADVDWAKQSSTAGKSVWITHANFASPAIHAA